MSTFTDQQISKWANLYEKEVCSKYDLVVDRLSLAVNSGYNEYELPNYVTNIRMVLWQGKCIYPKGFTSSIITGDTPFETTGSTPYEYTFAGKGQRVIKFYPSPNISIPVYAPVLPDIDLFTSNADAAAVIIEFYRTPSETDVNLQLPDYVRRYLLKDFICSKAFNIEGPTQDLRAAQFYRTKCEGHSEFISSIRESMHQININVLADKPRTTQRKPGRPVLPPNFGYPANY